MHNSLDITGYLFVRKGIRHLVTWRMAALLTVVICGWARPAGAAPPVSLREKPWVANDGVTAVACSNGVIYLGGRFTYIGPETGFGVPVSASTGQALGRFPQVNGIIASCLPDGVGGWYLRGAFTRVGGLEKAGLAHILADGSVDPAWNPNPNKSIDAWVLSGSTIYVGGGFTAIGGKPRRGIAALDAATGAVTNWNPGASPLFDVIPGFDVLAVSDSTVYALTQSTDSDGTCHCRMVLLNVATSDVSVKSFDADGRINALAPSGSTLYLGGEFNHIGGQFSTDGGKSRDYLAAFDAATGDITDWNPQATGWVNALAVSGSLVYVGGSFSQIGGRGRSGLAAVFMKDGLVTDWNPNPQLDKTRPAIYTLTLSDSTVYVGGRFSAIAGKSRLNAAAINADFGYATDWDPRAGGAVRALAVSGPAVYIGSDFESFGGQPRNGLAALNAATGAATDWNPGVSGDVQPYVSALAVAGSTVYVGGSFNNIGGQSRTALAAVDAVTGAIKAWNPQAERNVNALAVSGSTLYVGGYFYYMGGESRHSLAAFDIASGALKPWKPGAVNLVYYGWDRAGVYGYYVYPNPVYALAVYGSTVYVGGDFEHVGGSSQPYLGAVDAATGIARDWDPHINGPVKCLAATASTVYVGGDFTKVGDQPRSPVAALDAATGALKSWNPGAMSYGNGRAYANVLKIAGSRLYIGGTFTKIGVCTRYNLAVLDCLTGAVADWDPMAKGSAPCGLSGVNALSISPSGATVYVGGHYAMMSGLPRFCFAQLDNFCDVMQWRLWQ